MTQEEDIISQTDGYRLGIQVVKEFNYFALRKPHVDAFSLFMPWKNKARVALQESDAKIRHWSSGKEGNIRSLLSTMQHVSKHYYLPIPCNPIILSNQVLWLGNRWKHVKKIYQRALLFVHPDKGTSEGFGEASKIHCRIGF